MVQIACIVAKKLNCYDCKHGLSFDIYWIRNRCLKFKCVRQGKMFELNYFHVL